MEISKSECPDIWTRLPRHKWPKTWSNIEDPVVPLEANLYGHPFAGSMGERQFEKVLSGLGLRKYRVWNADSCIESKVYSFGVRDGHQNVWKDKSTILCGRNC